MAVITKEASTSTKPVRAKNIVCHFPEEPSYQIKFLNLS
jgi:hypothetical protein